MIELKHYIAHWLELNLLGFDESYSPYVIRKSERFLEREDAKIIVRKKREELEKCDIAKVKWFKETYFNDTDNYFFVEKCEKIY